MTGSHSTRPTVPYKPAKPSPDFPLFAHQSGQWAKKIAHRTCYFGPWHDPETAYQRYLREKDDLAAGRRPTRDENATTLKDALNAFLTAKKARRDEGQITLRTFNDYKLVCDLLIEHLGRTVAVADLRPHDFTLLRAKLSPGRGLVTVRNLIQRTRCVFNWCYEAGLIDHKLRYGPEFRPATKKQLRRHKQTQPVKLFTPAEIVAMADEAGVHVAAMIWLGVNCGFGNHDCGRLPLKAVDLRSGWIDFARPKTGAARRCPLWPETIDALRRSLRRRPSPAVAPARACFFVTRDGLCWAKETKTNPIANRISALTKRLGIHRQGVGFYSLRHVFQTIGDGAGDPLATKAIMGHLDGSISDEYREGLPSDARLLRVSNHVRAWLLAGAEQNQETMQLEPGRVAE